MRRPSGVRMGMFCRFGSDEDRRPVAATAWEALHRTDGGHAIVGEAAQAFARAEPHDTLAVLEHVVERRLSAGAEAVRWAEHAKLPVGIQDADLLTRAEPQTLVAIDARERHSREIGFRRQRERDRSRTLPAIQPLAVAEPQSSSGRR